MKPRRNGNKMRLKRVGLALGLSAAVLVGAACSGEDASDADIAEPEFDGDALPEDYSARAPELLTVFQNVDNHPTVVKVCLDGIAFRTVSTTHNGGFAGSVARVPEWDSDCPNYDASETSVSSEP